MCGIAGFLGAYSEGELRAMSARLSRRGPDDQGFFVDGIAGVGFAHRRLAIIDLSPSGHQPMEDASGRYVIAFNGEIYNYRELRQELVRAGVVFRGTSDTEVLLELFARQGESALPRLNGIFAFAIWDRVDRKLFLARDALGVKPLYWANPARGPVFASELKAIAPMLDDRTLDPASLHRYMTYLWCPGEGTPFKQVRKLGPGEAAIWTENRIERQWTWYSLPAHRPVGGILRGAEARHEVEGALRTAVTRQLVADVPVGAFLSGGVDSSAVVAFAREQCPDIRCFTIDLVGGGDVGFADDLPFARRVASHLQVPLEVVSVDASRMALDFADMIATLDEPLADPAPLNVLYISQLARNHGIKVLLSGAGGDDLFSGYRRHVALEYDWIWKWTPGVLRQAVVRMGSRLDARSASARRIQRLLHSIEGTTEDRIAGYFRWASEEAVRRLYSPDFIAALGAQAADAPLLEFLARTRPNCPALDRMLGLEQRFFLADHNLAYTDRMSMAAGVEVRVPFLDLDLVEVAARCSVADKLRSGEAKLVLKKAMEDRLPRDVIYRSKTGFGAPVRRWLQRELRPLAADLLSESSVRRRGIFDSKAIAELNRKNDSGEVDGAYTILALMSIELWCRAYVDRI